MNEPPETIISGWPEKQFRFTGEWEEMRTGGRRGTARNRRPLFLPIYQAEDGERICAAVFSCLTRHQPDAAISEQEAGSALPAARLMPGS